MFKKIRALVLASSTYFWLAVGCASAQPFVYVTNVSSNTVAVIDAASNTITATITVDSNPEEIAITPDGKRAYVTCGSFNTPSSVPVIDTATNTVVTTIAMPFGSFARGIAITPDGKTAYVGNLVANNVSIIDITTNTVTGTIAVGNSPIGVAISPNGTRAYVANNNSSSVSVIDTATNVVIGTVPVGDSPHNLVVTPDGKHVYVADTTYPQGYVSVIDTVTNQVTTFAAGAGTTWVALPPDGAHVYATNFDSVSVIDTANDSITSTIPAGTEEYGVAFTADGLHAYVAVNSGNNPAANSVSVIDTATSSVSATILLPPGAGAFGVAITPVSCHYLGLGISPSTVARGGKVTVTGNIMSCTSSSQTVSVQFTLTGPLGPKSCGTTSAVMFTSPPFTIAAGTNKTISFPFVIPKTACAGKFTITTTTLAAGKAVDSSSATLMVQ